MGNCNHSISTERLPEHAQPKTCDRPVWEGSNDDCCILHTEEFVEQSEELIAAIEESERIDGLEFGTQSLPGDFCFENIALFDANFQNSELNGCDFVESVVYNSRFEGAEMKNTSFIPENREESEHVVHDRTNTRSNNFSESDLKGARFCEVDLNNSEFDSKCLQSVDFVDCGMAELSFTNQNLKDTNFSYTTLRNTVFENCDLHNATFHASKLDRTQFVNSNLRNTDLRNAILNRTEFDNVRIDDQTQIDSYLVQEYLADRYSEGEYDEESVNDITQYLHKRRDKIPIDFESERSDRGLLTRLSHSATRFLRRYSGSTASTDFTYLEHARYRYRDLSQLFSDNGEPERARKYSIREKHSKRKNALRNDDSSWSWLLLTRWTMKYGEAPTQPLLVAILIIGFSALSYPLFGVLDTNTGQTIRYCICLPNMEALNDAISIIHLSIVRLFTPTNPSFQPNGLGIVVGLFESIAGALLTAMFVFTLGRRATE